MPTPPRYSPVHDALDVFARIDEMHIALEALATFDRLSGLIVESNFLSLGEAAVLMHLAIATAADRDHPTITEMARRVRMTRQGASLIIQDFTRRGIVCRKGPIRRPQSQSQFRVNWSWFYPPAEVEIDPSPSELAAS